MKLNFLALQNFRNLKEVKLQLPDHPLIVFQGKNAQGKTNLLESIYVLAYAKSFRHPAATNLINWNKDTCRLQGMFEEGTIIEREIVLSKIHNHHKSIKQNRKNIKISDFVQQIPLVLFTPEDVYHLNSSSAWRRRYLDRILSQIDTNYLFHHSRLNMVLKQRNALLKQNMNQHIRLQELEVWDDRMALSSAYITARRHELLHVLNSKLPKWYQTIAQTSEKPNLYYQPSSSSFTEQDWKKTLATARENDILSQTTTIGPQRDDIICQLENQTISEGPSRGENRSFFLSLKRAEIEHLHETTQKRPIVLLDDVFSELDLDRQKHLLNLLENYQTIITTNHFPDVFKEKAALFEVEGGSIAKV